MLKKLPARIILPAFAALMAFAAAMAAPRPAAAEIEALAATYPLYLFTQKIMAGAPGGRVTLMTDSPDGGRGYIPAPAELERLSQAAILVSGGLAREAFLERALAVAKPQLQIIDAGGGGPAIIIDLEAARTWYRRPPPAGTADAPLFASPSGALVMAGHIAEGLAGLDPQSAGLYRANAAAFTAQLKDLLEKFQAAARPWQSPRVILSHGVLNPLAADLGLGVAAVIEENGAAPSPAPAGRLAELAALAEREGVRAILAAPGRDLDQARALGAAARLPVAVIDPAASGPADPPPDYYQKVLLSDLEVLNALFQLPPEKTGSLR